MPEFNRIADVEFAVGNTQVRVEVKGLPYVWDSAKSYDMDFPGVMAAIDYLKEQHGMKAGLNLIMVSSRPDNHQI